MKVFNVNASFRNACCLQVCVESSDVVTLNHPFRYIFIETEIVNITKVRYAKLRMINNILWEIYCSFVLTRRLLVVWYPLYCVRFRENLNRI